MKPYQRLLVFFIFVLAAAAAVMWFYDQSLRRQNQKSDAGIYSTSDDFFTFSSTTPADEPEIDRLNDELDSLRKKYERLTASGEETWNVDSRVAASERVLQGTIYVTDTWTGLTGEPRTERWLASYGFDKQTHTGYTAKDALKESGMTGVDLSTKVEQALRTLDPDAELRSTEMQGFQLDSQTGKIKFIYMRVMVRVTDDQGEETDEERFYLYDPAALAMQQMNWPET